MAQHDDRLLTVGSLGAPYGVQGWIRVNSSTAPPEQIFAYSPWWLKLGGERVVIRVDDGRVHGKRLVARLEGYEDRDAVRALVGAEIAVERERFEKPAADEYYWVDLVGATVVNLEGRELGRIDHLIETGANDVMIVDGEQRRLIPFVPGRYVIEVDIAGRRIVVDWDPDWDAEV